MAALFGPAAAFPRPAPRTPLGEPLGGGVDSCWPTSAPLYEGALYPSVPLDEKVVGLGVVVSTSVDCSAAGKHGDTALRIQSQNFFFFGFC